MRVRNPVSPIEEHPRARIPFISGPAVLLGYSRSSGPAVLLGYSRSSGPEVLLGYSRSSGPAVLLGYRTSSPAVQLGHSRTLGERRPGVWVGNQKQKSFVLGLVSRYSTNIFHQRKVICMSGLSFQNVCVCVCVCVSLHACVRACARGSTNITLYIC